MVKLLMMMWMRLLGGHRQPHHLGTGRHGDRGQGTDSEGAPQETDALGGSPEARLGLELALSQLVGGDGNDLETGRALCRERE